MFKLSWKSRPSRLCSDFLTRNFNALGMWEKWMWLKKYYSREIRIKIPPAQVLIDSFSENNETIFLENYSQRIFSRAIPREPLR